MKRKTAWHMKVSMVRGFAPGRKGSAKYDPLRVRLWWFDDIGTP